MADSSAPSQGQKAKRAQSKETKEALRRAVRLRHLRWLANDRHGVHDDQHNRLLLKAMLAWGMEGPAALEWAPWVRDELQDIINEVDSKPPWHWTSERIGQMVELTGEERERGKLFSMRPCDVEWSVIQERNRGRKRERDRKRVSDKRRRVKMGIDLDVRAESIFATLDGTWMPVSTLAKKLAGGRAWRTPDGAPLAEAKWAARSTGKRAEGLTNMTRDIGAYIQALSGRRLQLL